MRRPVGCPVPTLTRQLKLSTGALRSTHLIVIVRITYLHAWLDPIIEYEIRRIREEDEELVENMRRASLSPSGSSPSTPRAQRTASRTAQPMSPPPIGGALALLNERASQQRPPKTLTWHESDVGEAHARIFTAELEGEFPVGLRVAQTHWIARIA